MFIDVRDPHTKRLLFRYDPQRALIEIKHRDAKIVVDLTEYQSQPTPEHDRIHEQPPRS